MPTRQQAQAGLAVGVDAGASTVRVLALRHGRPVWRVRTRAVEPAGLGKLLRSIWKTNTGSSTARTLVVASRGIWTPRERAALARALRGLAPRVRVLADVEAALLGALDGRPGVLILAGTGAIALGRDTRGRWRRAGGLGPLLGDEGSGFWLGREWLRARAGRGWLPPRRLLGGPDAVRRIAALAPQVIRRARRGDRRAAAIVRAAQEHLAALGAEVARGLALPEPVTVSWAGSIMGDSWFRAGVGRALGRAGVRARWRAPAMEPVVAAARLAERLRSP